MNEVHELLQQAWQKAYEQGFVLRSADFRMIETHYNNQQLTDVRVDGYLKEKTND